MRARVRHLLRVALGCELLTIFPAPYLRYIFGQIPTPLAQVVGQYAGYLTRRFHAAPYALYGQPYLLYRYLRDAFAVA
jgi:hypothetical protein